MKSSPTSPDRIAIEARQIALLESLLQTIIPVNPFYTRKLAGIDPADASRSLESFRSLVPFTSKDELVQDQAAHPPYGSNLTYPRERYTHYNQTSATTAAPLRWLDTPESWSWMLDRWMMVLRLAGVKPEDRCYFAFSFGPFLGFWTAFGAAQKLGCLCIPGGGQSTPGRLHAILDNEATVLCSTPTYALHMLEVARQENIELSASRVRAVFVAGEPGGAIPATRQVISNGWNGASVWDQYGMTEMGPVPFECPIRSGVLHVMESAYIPEVIDPRTLNPVAPGEHGELVLTNLGRLGSPLLRYRTGDLVRHSAENMCACGRPDLALPGGILGRTDDMVVVRGVKVYPSAVEEIVRAFPEIAEYRVEIDIAESLKKMTLIFEPREGFRDVSGLAHRLDNALRTALSMRVRVETAQPGTLQRFEMKARRWQKRA
jgi:phenylacetate-CoA ligase